MKVTIEIPDEWQPHIAARQGCDDKNIRDTIVALIYYGLLFLEFRDRGIRESFREINCFQCKSKTSKCDHFKRKPNDSPAS